MEVGCSIVLVTTTIWCQFHTAVGPSTSCSIHQPPHLRKVDESYTRHVYSLSTPISLCLPLPHHTHTHTHTHWDKSWGNGCPCFVGPPVHPGYKSKYPVRVNPLCGKEPGPCVCVCVRKRWHRPVWNVPHEWQTGSGCPAGREQSPLLDHLPSNTDTHTPNPVHIPWGASSLSITHPTQLLLLQRGKIKEYTCDQALSTGATDYEHVLLHLLLNQTVWNYSELKLMCKTCAFFFFSVTSTVITDLHKCVNHLKSQHLSSAL